jgi:ComF family protein
VSFLFLYEQKTLRRLLHAYKYEYLEAAEAVFEEFLMGEKLNILRIPADLAIPLPLHKRKLRERGFNQAERVGRTVSSLLRKPLITDILLRRRAGQAQMQVRRREDRMRNVKGVFRVERPHLVKGRNILLVDDVMTTGATLGEAARVLKDAGAKNVFGFVLARD